MTRIKVIVSLIIFVLILDIHAKNHIIPPDLVRVAHESNCDPISANDYFSGISFGKNPPYVYGVFDYSSSSAAFWCTKSIEGKINLFLIVTSDSSNTNADKYVIDYIPGDKDDILKIKQEKFSIPGLTLDYSSKKYNYKIKLSSFFVHPDWSKDEVVRQYTPTTNENQFIENPRLEVSFDGGGTFFYFHKGLVLYQDIHVSE